MTGALFVALVATPATAGFAQNQDNSQLISRLNQLENQVQTLSRSVYRGAPPPQNFNATPAETSSLVAGYDERISAIEQRQREITGKIEQMAYDIQQMRERLGRASADSYPAAEQRRSSGDSTYRNDRQEPVASQATLGNLSRGPGTPDALYEEAFSDIREARYDSAAAKFQQFVGKYPRHALASNAQYWLAETYYVRGDYRQSAKMFAQGYQDYPQGAKAAASLLKLGLSLSRLGKKDDACLSFAQLKKEFQGSQTPEIRSAGQEMKQLGCPG